MTAGVSHLIDEAATRRLLESAGLAEAAWEDVTRAIEQDVTAAGTGAAGRAPSLGTVIGADMPARMANAVAGIRDGRSATCGESS